MEENNYEEGVGKAKMKGRRRKEIEWKIVSVHFKKIHFARKIICCDIFVYFIFCAGSTSERRLDCILHGLAIIPTHSFFRHLLVSSFSFTVSSL